MSIFLVQGLCFRSGENRFGHGTEESKCAVLHDGCELSGPGSIAERAKWRNGSLEPIHTTKYSHKAVILTDFSTDSKSQTAYRW